MKDFKDYQINELQQYLEKYFTLVEKVASYFSVEISLYKTMIEKDPNFPNTEAGKIIKREVDFYKSLGEPRI